jgi:hypothetical protein
MGEVNGHRMKLLDDEKDPELQALDGLTVAIGVIGWLLGVSALVGWICA